MDYDWNHNVGLADRNWELPSRKMGDSIRYWDIWEIEAPKKGGFHQITPTQNDSILRKIGDSLPLWVNYHISLTWIVRPIWGWFPLLTMISSEGEQWSRYNLPRYIPEKRGISFPFFKCHWSSGAVARWTTGGASAPVSGGVLYIGIPWNSPSKIEQIW